jgi:hypothetical protein
MQMNKLSYSKWAKADNAHAPTPIFGKKLWFSARLPALVLLKMYEYTPLLIITYIFILKNRDNLRIFHRSKHGYFWFRRVGLWGREDQKPSTVQLNPFLRGRDLTCKVEPITAHKILMIIHIWCSECAYFSRTRIGRKLLFTWTSLFMIASFRMQPIRRQPVAAVRWRVRIFINY